MSQSNSYEAFKKNELELALDEYLTENSKEFVSDPMVAPYYSSRARTIGSPLKKSQSGQVADEVVDKLKSARRRASKLAEESKLAAEDSTAPR